MRLADAVRVGPLPRCVEKDAVVEQVTAWLGDNRIDAELGVEVYGADAPRFVAFRLRRGSRIIAERRFEPPPARCDHLHAAVGLAIALALKAQVLDEITGNPSFLEPPRRLSLAADARFAWNVLPGAAFGGGAHVEYPLGKGFVVRGGLFGLAALPHSLGEGQGEFTAALVAGDAGACVAVFTAGDFDGRACVGFAAGALHATGSGYDVSRSSTLPWFSVSQSFGVAVRLGPAWSLAAVASLVLPLHSTHYAVRTATGAPVWDRDPDPFGVSVALGPRHEF